MLTRRLQVLLDEELPASLPDAQDAADQLLAAEPTPVGDWSGLKRELLDARGGAS